MRMPLLKTGLLLLTLTACTEEKAAPPAPAKTQTPPSTTGAQSQTTPTPATPAPTPPPTETPPPPAGEQPEHGASAAPRTRPPAEKPGPWQKKALEGKDLYATMVTNQGNIVVKLFAKDAPLTVANFVGLANGEQEWTDPRTGKLQQKTPLYQNIIFHRIIPGFMIQGGDALGTGTGTPGYNFEDEFQSGRRFDKPGLLAMANRGRGTQSNGSQFFITVSTPGHLNGGHTIFGEVVKGYDVVEAMSKVQTGPMDKPVKDVVLKKVTLSDTQPK
ncbi:peptidylprolyl isomerase [Melittangium boletus]|uniref:Peptidyl-prolyl cis-trans isomerase n=1 Tax=Melittangium boletus DSM 14713 TaxID=1294270 RepID=A0A250IJT6_9BACT|nr:peptidylprolyl isomerase [Melittangium boletus]ATB31196.1 peptidyl-prolyl cis-trans isomerase [Melittangium boletus DSM 14713]